MTVSDDRILVFCTRDLLSLICRSPVIIMDGTFKAAPRTFTQLESIHIEYQGHYLTGLIAFLPDKRQATYKRLFKLIQGG